MATTQEKSTEVTNVGASPQTFNSPQYGAKLKIFPFSFTQGAGAGDTLSTVDLVHVPANSKIVKSLSEIVVSAFGSARTLDIGHVAYTRQNGVAQVLVADNILDGGDVSSAAALALGAGTNAAGDNTIDLENRDIVVIQAKVTGTGTIPAGATIKGFIAVLVD